MREPQEIEDEEHEQVVERVAAVDVAKASGMVCTRVPVPLQNAVMASDDLGFIESFTRPGGTR
jgi:hypothetical protein